MTILISVCARSGSKGVKNKNLALINNIPLVEHTFKQINKLPYKKIVVISSDSMKINKISNKYKDFIFIHRPKNLAGDKSAKIDALKHLLKFIISKYPSKKFDTLLDLDPTSPMRNLEDIKNAYQLFLKNKECDTVISGYLTNRNPYFNLVEKHHNSYLSVCIGSNKNYTSRQKSPKVYALNSSIYIYDIKSLLRRKRIISNKTLLFEMPQERSLDIDSKFDLKVMRKLFEK